MRFYSALFSVVLASLPASLALFGCASASDADDLGNNSAELGTLSAAELARTKAALREIANANTTRTDNYAQVRAQVQPLVDKLAKHFGVRPASAKLPLIKGAWKQSWSDFPFMMNGFNKMDLNQVYQVVSEDGYYYNLGDSTAFFFLGTTGVLRGAYTTNGTKLNIEFTNVGFKFGRLSKSRDLVSYASAFEAGTTTSIGIPGGGRAPKGPVGIKGTLETLYADADLRIERGTQTAFTDESGAVLIPGIGEKIFLLDRVTMPVK
jgi:PAP_fibrillin